MEPPRQLQRLFTTHLGQTPADYVRSARVDAAAHLLTTSSQTIPQVAKACGLGGAETLRRLFAERYGVTPARYRSLYRTADESPGHL